AGRLRLFVTAVRALGMIRRRHGWHGLGIFFGAIGPREEDGHTPELPLELALELAGPVAGDLVRQLAPGVADLLVVGGQVHELEQRRAVGAGRSEHTDL